MRFILLSTLLLAPLGGCSAPEQPAAFVNVRVFETGSASEQGSQAALTGIIGARVEPVLAFREGGRIAERLVSDGEIVRAGQLLARLDTADLSDAASAALAEAGAANAAVDAARASAERAASDELRLRGLSEGGAIAARDYDAAVEGARTNAAMLRAAQGQAAAAAANARVQRNRASYTELRAPAAGVVSAVFAEAGQVVAPGTPVMRLAQGDERELVVEVPEQQRGSLPRTAVAELYAGGTIQLILREVAAAADPATRTYRARYRITGAAPPLGSTATLRWADASNSDALPVPVAAVTERGEGPGVWIINAKGVAIWRPVTVSATNGEQAFIKGIRRGERIVGLGAHLIQSGQAVRAIAVAQRKAR
jgi:RND family efflux transporter MFP subunit